MTASLTNDSRRSLLKFALGSAVLFAPTRWTWVFAQTDGTVKLLRAPKMALVIGNSAYQSSPLKNPANDARAIAGVLKSTGFDVTSRLDASRGDLASAVQAYTQALAQRQAVGIFYFAGHGLQLAWRNYMVPVDANVRSAAEIQAQCVELGDLLAGIAKARNPLNVIILDACRDNPFGGLSGVDQKGLSQMDAPPGTLLAYATAPGNVASDGEGANGLYTEHLLKEIAIPEAKVEDVFKRVRLHVRRRTNGQQIPWESTSLEEDYYLVPPKALSARAAEEAERERREEEARLEKQRLAEEAERKRKLELALKEAQRIAEEKERRRREEQARQEAKRAEEEAERQRKEALALRERQARSGLSDSARAERLYAEEVAIWEKIKTAQEPGPLEEYLLRFPSGRFSELAQFQLDRVLARRGEKKIEAVTSSANPYTKGTLRADTDYKVGDFFRYRVLDRLTQIELRTMSQRVTAVGDYEVQFNKGGFVTDLLGNFVRNLKTEYSGQQFFLPEYGVGKRWAARYQRRSGEWPARDITREFRVVGKESITVPAGTFDAFRIESNGWTRTNDGNTVIQLLTRYWMAPRVPRYILMENDERNSFGRTIISERLELISFERK